MIRIHDRQYVDFKHIIILMTMTCLLYNDLLLSNMMNRLGLNVIFRMLKRQRPYWSHLVKRIYFLGWNKHVFYTNIARQILTILSQGSLCSAQDHVWNFLLIIFLPRFQDVGSWCVGGSQTFRLVMWPCGPWPLAAQHTMPLRQLHCKG